MNTDNLITLDNHLNQNKILGVNAIPLIKHNILHSVEDWMKVFYDSISDEYRKELLLRLDEIWNNFNESSSADKEQLLTQISDLYSGQENMQQAINMLKNSVKSLESEAEDDNEHSGSVLNTAEIKKILMASLIDHTFWTDDTIGAPNLMGNNIIGLIGLFGTIKASNIKGDLIEGKTFQSDNDVELITGISYERYDSEGNKLENNPYIAEEGDKGPSWQLRADGDGYLAGGKVSWDSKGTVKLTGVKIDFNDIENTPDDFGKGDDGISIFTSTVFIRQNETPDIPEGGSFEDPLPRTSIENGIIWEDTIPIDSNEILWSSTRIFASDSTSSINQNNWSEPSQMTDTSDFEVIFGIETADLNNLPNLPITDGLNDHFGWYDNDTDIKDKEIWYMATATCKNGEWSSWKVSKIKGENGKDGKSITIKGSFDTLEEFKEQIAGDDLKTPPADNDFSAAHIVERDLYIWDIAENIWKNVGRFNGIDGMSKFKSIIFKRSNTPLTDLPTGGKWDYPIADGWEDGIPEGTGIIWTSYRTWYSNDEMNENIKWSTPKILQDSNSFDVAYGTSKVKKDDGSLDLTGLPVDSKGNANPSDTFMSPWYDEPENISEDDEIWYMATAECKNNAWGKWVVTKIKGEDGTNGTSIKIVGEFESVEKLKQNFPNGPANLDDTYIVEKDLYVYINGNWTNVGQIKGDDGDSGTSQFLHMKYAISLGEVDNTNTPLDYTKIDLTENDGESTVDAKWLGIGLTNSIDNPNGKDPDPKGEKGYIYKWTKIYVDPIITPAKFRSIVFARINESILPANQKWPNVVKVTGGDWNNAKPNNSTLYGHTIVWEDGIPTGNTPIWTTTATFDSEVDYSKTTIEWETPKLMADNDAFETAYAPESIVVNGIIDETGLPTQNGVIGGLADPSKSFTNGWTDEPEAGVEYYYMATAQKSGGTWSTWKIFKIKGEKGDKGGSVKLSTSFNTVEKLIEHYSDGENGNNGEPIDAYKDNAHIIKNGPIKSGTDPVEYEWQNHLFVWIGEQTDDSSLTDGDYFYKGWYDSGQFNGTDGKDGKNGTNAYVHIKYAKSIVYNNDGTLNTDKCETTKNGGESTEDANWIGIAHTTSVDNSSGTDPELKGEGWNKYKWSPFVTDEDVEKRVTTKLGTYHISSNHIAGKTIDTAVDNGTNNTNNYVQLEAGTPYVTFTMDADGQETQSEEKIAIGDGKEGPAWQLRNDGAGYLASGNIRWNKEGKVEFGEGVELTWNSAWDDKIPEVPEIPEGFTEEQIKGFATEITNNSLRTLTINAAQITSGKITADQIDASVLTADAIIGNELVGKTIKSSDDSWEIGKDGDGHLANHNIEWNKDGDLTVKSVNGAVTIGEGVGVGPWKTFKYGNIDYVGDNDTFNSSTNVFGSDGTFKIGGANGIVKANKNGKVTISSAVEFVSNKETRIYGNFDNEKYNFWAKDSGETIVETASTMILCLYLNIDGSNYYAYGIDEMTSVVEGTTLYLLKWDDAEGWVSLEEGTIAQVKEVDPNAGISEEDLNEWWNKTEINGGKIKTGTLDVNNVLAGKINAENIDVDNLNVKKLNTTGDVTTAGTVKIEENTISINDFTYDREILNISGTSKLNPLPNPSAKLSIDASNEGTIIGTGSDSVNNLFNGSKYKKLKTFTLPKSEFDYTLNIGDSTVILEFTTTGLTRKISIDFDCKFVITTNSNYNKSFGSPGENVIYLSDSNGNGYRNELKNKPWYLEEREITTDSISLNGETTYYIFLVYAIGGYEDYKSNITNCSFICDVPYLKYKTTFYPKCDISSLGTRIIMDGDRYISFLDDGGFKIKHGNNCIMLNDDNIYMGFNSFLGLGSNISVYENKMYQVVPTVINGNIVLSLKATNINNV